MSTRLKVLISAYACEPNKGSEPEVGWQWAMEMAQRHDVTVLTRANNQEPIEKALAGISAQQPRPRFVYHDGPAWQLLLKRAGGVRLYYLLWQHSARQIVAALHKRQPFDLMHHVTFAGFRFPTVIWGHDIPSIWGPVGGVETVPWRLLPWKHPLPLIQETVRNWHNRLHATASPAFTRRLRQSTLVLASTHEMLRAVQRHGLQAELLPTIGLRQEEMTFHEKSPPSGALRLLFVGNFHTHKGVDLALEALHQSGTDATLTLIGDGGLLGAAQTLAARLGLGGRVSFLGRLPRSKVLEAYQNYDVLMFLAQHDTGGYAAIEAMYYQLPVICLDTGGLSVAVEEDCGVKVPLSTRQEVIAGVANAIRRYDTDRETLHRQSQRARESVLARYDWTRKGRKMDEFYRRAVGMFRR